MENPTRIFDFIYYQQSHYPQDVAYIYRNEGKEALRYSTNEVVDLANKISRGLLRMGLRPGDMIGTVIAKNRPEWIALDLGMAQIGVVNVPVYPTIASSDYVYIFNEAKIKLCFVGDDAAGSVYKKVKKAQAEVASLATIYTFDKVDYAPHWSDIWQNETDTEGGQKEVERIKATVRPDDMATIIYTSGTTGQPKGVMLSHDNIVSNIMSVRHLIPMKAGDRGLSFLPLNHIFERTCSYAYMFIGAQVTFTGVDNLGGDEGDLKAVKPHFFTTVPRLLEKVYEKIYNKGLELKGIKRSLFFWALGLTDDYEYDKTYSGLDKIKRNIANKLIFSKWREALGGCVQGIIVGASPCPVKIARTFSAAGIPVREGYGMTETSPGIAISTFEKGRAKLGYVGPILDGVEVTIDPSDGNYKENEGEILCAGRNVMMGYYNKPEETAAVIKHKDGKRWMCTGDIGRVDDVNGVKMLKITDRKKELMKTSGGKYVAPAPIENKIRENFLVEQIMIVGDNQKFVSALIVPAQEALKDWCQENGIGWTHIQEVIGHDSVVKKYKELVNYYNPNFAKVEQIKEFRLVSDNWEPVKPDGSPGELTPTMKLKRRVLLEKYEGVIREIYG
ncbi:MAG: long-chain fatty acid--CoA ligase [Saprospiraceae bacterium]|nr:long-chain fatty acid--CoA ligase [Saprospiraceae bacterium]